MPAFMPFFTVCGCKHGRVWIFESSAHVCKASNKRARSGMRMIREEPCQRIKHFDHLFLLNPIEALLVLDDSR